jgi:hypothetical protein
MTPRLLQLYETLHAWRACHGCLPTLAELERACGLKQWQTYCGLVGLRARGLVGEVVN